MADVITRFKLETNQFDSALRDAANGLTNITKQLSLAGKDFDKFAQKHVESARSLGQVESGANNLKDKLRDLVSAYNNVAKAYNNLTKEQQQGDLGKAMAASLDQLQGRITQTKNELYNMSDSTKQAGGNLGSLNDIFGMSISKLAGWGTAIAAAKGALDVAKDAFFASEQNVDAWGSTIESTQAVYESFLTSINSGDVSGFLSRIGQITNAAIEAYNALDQLNTQKTIQSPQVAIKQAEISRMRTMLQTGRYVAPADGRSTGGMKTGDVLTKEQIANVSKNLEQALNEVATITRSQVKTASTAIDKLYAEQAEVLGVSKQRFQQATSSWQNFQAAMDKANEYERWKKENTTYTTQTISTGAVISTPSYDDSKNPYRDWAWVSRFKDDGERFQRLIQEIQNRESAKSSLYSQYGQAYRRINRAEGINPYGGNGTTDKTETELKQNEAAVAKLTEEYQKLATDAKTANDAQLSGIKERQSAIQTEIANLKARNEELKKFAAEAQGIQVNIGINSSLPDLTAKLKELQAAQSQALNGAEWQEYQKQIEQVSLQIDAMKGKWKDGMKATISVNTESIQKAIGESSKLQDLITKPKKQTSSTTVESNANNVASEASKLEDIITKPKTGKVTITADTTDAKSKVEEVDSMIGDKTAKVTFTADNAEVLQKAAQIDGVQIDPKTLTVTANTAEAEDALSNIEGLTLHPKELDITADVQKVLDAITQIDGVQIDPKTLTVTALTAEAENALSNIEGLTLQPKELDINADAQKVFDVITQIDGVTVDPKTLEITANTADAYSKLQELFANIEGTTVTFNVEPKQTEMSTGMSITTQGGMNSYISQLKSDLANADLGSELYNSIASKLTDMTSLSNLVAESMKAGLGTALFDAADILGEDFWTRAMEGGVEDIDWQGIVDKINEKLKEMGLDSISLDFETGNVSSESGKKDKNEKGGGNDFGKILSGVSTITSSLQQLGVEVPEELTKVISVLQIIMSIVTTISSLAAIIATTSAIKSIPIIGWFLHNGGVVHAATGYTVPGTNYSNDQVPAMLNSGELVLNKAQQGNLLSQLDNNGQGQTSQPYITGETIYLGLNNYLRRVGQGEILTTR